MKTREERKLERAPKCLDALELVFLILAILCFVCAALLPEPEAQALELEPAAFEPEAPELIEPAYDPAWDKPAEENAACTDIYLGEYTLTAYCACPICCGAYSNGYTATGTWATEGRTIAVDPSVITYGSRVTLILPDGTQHEYIAEDCGSGINGNRIDVFIADHEDARVFGVQHAAAYLTE